MTTEERQKAQWLGRYNGISRRINRLEEEIEMWRCKLEGLGSPLIDGMPHGHSSNPQKEELILKIIDIDNLLTDELLKLTAAKQDIFDAINTVKDPTLQVLLEHRYLDGMRWEDICVELHYSWRQVHRMHLQALRQVEMEDDTQ